MTYSWRLYLRDPWVVAPLGLFVAASSWSAVRLISLVWSSESTLVLHYSIIFGVDWVVSRWEIVWLALAWFLPLAVNFLLAWRWYAEERFLARFLLLISAPLSLGWLAVFILLQRLNS